MRYLALGDSYTIGEGVEPAGRWPSQLAALLRAGGAPCGAPEIIARTGWTTDELSSAVDGAAPAGPFALVTLLVGVNDQYRGGAAEEYRALLRPLLARASGLAAGAASRVVVLSIPDWGVTPFAEGRSRAGIAAAIDSFNQVSREEARRAGARWVDVTAISRRLGPQREGLAADGLHPSAAQYSEWAHAALPEARAALGVAAKP